MSISAAEIELPYAVDVSITDDTLTVDLSDGRTISAPIGWYPRLANGTDEERQKWWLIGRGHGIHWEDLDEDVSVEGLLARHAFRREPTIAQTMAREQEYGANRVGGSF